MTRPSHWVLMFACFAFGQAVWAKPAQLGLSKPINASFKCKDGTQGTLSYYSLTDQSLRFLKLRFGGKTHTLPQVVSGSGSRYSDSITVEWFEKGGTAMLNKDVGNEKSPSVACKLTALPAK